MVGEAVRCAETYALRGYDAVQLASALFVSRAQLPGSSPLTLVSADFDLNAAATAEGLLIEDPNNH